MQRWIWAVMPLLACCATDAPEMRISTADLPLVTPAGRAALRERVTIASGDLCARRGNEVTPVTSRGDTHYCLDFMRSDIVAGMPDDVRRAYWLGLREAGVRGRGL